MKVMVRFQSMQRGEETTPLGPFKYVQLTYAEIQVESQPLGFFRCQGGWWIDEKTGKQWSDVVIYPVEDK